MVEEEEAIETKCKLVVSFLLDHEYLLTAFELLHELLEDGQFSAASRLQDFFSDGKRFPLEEMMSLQSLPALSLQKISDEREKALAQVAVMEYELRLAKEDMAELKSRLEQRQSQQEELVYSASLASAEKTDVPVNAEDTECLISTSSEDLSESERVAVNPLEQDVRRDLNCAVKEYLVTAGYKLTAMTFCDEAVGQDLDQWQSGPAYVENALQAYYKQYLAARETAEQLQVLSLEKEGLLQKLKEFGDDALSLSNKCSCQAEQIEVLQSMVSRMSSESDAQRQEADSMKSELESLRVHLQAAQQEAVQAMANSKILEAEMAGAAVKLEKAESIAKQLQAVIASHEEKLMSSKEEKRGDTAAAEEQTSDTTVTLDDSTKHSQSNVCQRDTLPGGKSVCVEEVEEKQVRMGEGGDRVGAECHDAQRSAGDAGGDSAEEPKATLAAPGSHGIATVGEVTSTESGDGGEMAAVMMIADTIPNLVPNILLHRREDVLPLLCCAIEFHPDASTRTSLISLLFTLVHKPEEEQRRKVTDACVALAARLGSQRAEQELLPHCWEQVSHKQEEGRLLAASLCGQLAPHVSSSLLLDHLAKLAHDSCDDVRLETARSLELLLLPDVTPSEEYDKLQACLFALLLSPPPSAPLLEYSLHHTLPALVAWLKAHRRPLSHLLQALLGKLQELPQLCPPLQRFSSPAPPPALTDSTTATPALPSLVQLLDLDDASRWRTQAVLRALIQLLPEVRLALIKTCPEELRRQTREEGGEGGGDTEQDIGVDDVTELSSATIQGYINSRGDGAATASSSSPPPPRPLVWPALDWLAWDYLPCLLCLACRLPPREHSLRGQLLATLLATARAVGAAATALVTLPAFLTAAGYPQPAQGDGGPGAQAWRDKLSSLAPAPGVHGERIARMCVLPLLLAGVLAAPGLRDFSLADYLRDLVLSTCLASGRAWSERETPDLIDAVRVLGADSSVHHDVILRVLWDCVVNPTPAVRSTAAVLLCTLAGSVDLRRVSQQVLPALVTLASDAAPEVRHSSVAAFGAVAKHFSQEDMVVEKVRVQMESFCEDGTLESVMAVVQALTPAVPTATAGLRDYVLQKMLSLATTSAPVASREQQREKIDVLYAAVTALDATDVTPASVQACLIPTAQILLKDADLLSPARRDILENIVKERGGLRLDVLGKAMGKSLFGDSSIFNKTAENGNGVTNSQHNVAEESKLRRMMRMKYEEVLGGSKSSKFKQVTDN